MQKQKRMHRREFRNYSELHKENILEKIKQPSINEMQNMDGIVIIPDLHFRCMEAIMRLKDIMFFMHQC